MAKEIVLKEYDRACWQLEKARKVDEVKEVRLKALAIKAYAKQAKNKQLEADAWEIRVRAERRLGEMMENGKFDRAGVGRPNKNMGVSDNLLPPTLDEMGIGKSLANRARRLAELPEKEFGLMVIDGRSDVEHTVEKAPQLKAKPKKKPKPQREFECPHCGKSVYLKDGRLEK